MNWISLKLRRLSTKLYLVFILMFVTLTAVVVTSYIAIETQGQHLILTDVLGEQEIMAERVTFTLTSIGEMGLNNPQSYNENIESQKDVINTYYRRVQDILTGFKNYEFEYTKGNIIELEFAESFRMEFDAVVQANLEIWDEVGYYIEHLTNPNHLEEQGEYAQKLSELKSLK